MASGTRFRIGMDSGGTFTDVVVLDQDTRTWSLYKVLSEHDQPSSILKAGLAKAAEGAGLEPAEFISETSMFIVGTTVATNALLQHRGAKAAMLTTAGHEDSVEIREGHKEDGHRYDWEFRPAEMLIPRERRIGIPGRIIWDGTEHQPLDLAAVEAAARQFAALDVNAVGISFLWSFANPAHEQAAAEVIRRELPGVHLTLSHELLPMLGDYNRVSTVALNSYLAPVVSRFVTGMETALNDAGFTGAIRYFQANGGMASGQSLIARAVYALNSGPAAAPTAGAEISRMYERDVITIDAGGTSLDVGLVHGAETDVRLVSDVARYRTAVPMVNIDTLGAGGGSIGHLDERGLLAVGPQSAESRPGPACYGFGGKEPTVTDAFVLLGWFSQDSLLGGEMPIYPEAAEAAIRERIAEPLGLSVEEAAEGIIQIAAENMVGGVRRISIEAGHDPRDAVLVAVGGSGPAFGCRLATELEMTTVVIPRVASGFCAFGAALSDVQHDYVRTHTRPIAQIDYHALNALLEGLEQRGRDELARDGFAPESMRVRRAFEMRYHDQVHNCLVGVDISGELTPENMQTVRTAFDRRHEELFTYAEPWNEAVVVNVHIRVIGDTTQDGERWYRPASAQAATQDTRGVSQREIFLPSRGGRVTTPVISAARVAEYGTVTGPAVIEEVTTTIFVEEGWSVRLDDRGFYELNRVAQPEVVSVGNPIATEVQI